MSEKKNNRKGSMHLGTISGIDLIMNRQGKASSVESVKKSAHVHLREDEKPKNKKRWKQDVKKYIG